MRRRVGMRCDVARGPRVMPSSTGALAHTQIHIFISAGVVAHANKRRALWSSLGAKFSRLCGRAMWLMPEAASERGCGREEGRRIYRRIVGEFRHFLLAFSYTLHTSAKISSRLRDASVTVTRTSVSRVSYVMQDE